LLLLVFEISFLVVDGFRKIKSEAAEHALWWEFRHPHFLRDQPQLLCEIKRSVHYGQFLVFFCHSIIFNNFVVFISE
jgi:hypothetical protein